MRKDGHQTGIVAEYYVLSQLYRYDHDAYITTGNKKSVDIQVFHENGTAVSIDVKAVRAYSSWPVTNIKISKNNFIAFVAYKNKFDGLNTLTDVYIIPSEKVKSYKAKGGDRTNKTDVKSYINNWELIEGRANRTSMLKLDNTFFP